MKIFVSSTYTDLIDYRKAAERAINLLDQQFKGMEYFGARPEEPKTACLKEIEQADVFVGIYAHRYGFIPDGDAKSITEQEFDHAQKLGKPIFCYKVSDKQPWLLEFVEKDEAKKKSLGDFIKRIEKDFVRNEFTTPDDLLAKISANLSRYLATHGAVALITHPLPPVPYYVHTYPLQVHFTGRKSEREQLNDWMGRDARSVFVLEAIGGMGKSALAWVWTQEIFSLGIPVAGVFWWSFYEERDLGRFLEKAIEYASGGKIDPKQIPSDRDRVDALANLLRQSRFLFVLDGFERVLRAYARMDAAYLGDDAERGEDEHNYRACTDPNLGIFLRCLASGGTLTKTLITSRLYPRELDELESVRHLPLTGIDAEDAVEFFHKQGIKGTSTEIKNACAAYGFHPLTLRLLAGALKQDPRYHADINNAPNVEMRDADKEKRMQRMLEFAYNSLPSQERKLLSQLSAFRSPMTWDALKKIFIAAERKRTQRNILDLLRNFRAPALKFGFHSEDDLSHAITDLQRRGLCMRDGITDTFDLHPVIRRYSYEHLSDRVATHERFIGYFEKIEKPKEIQSLANLQATVELYHHTVRAGQYVEAWRLYDLKLRDPLYYRLCAFQYDKELLDELINVENWTPRLIDSRDKTWVMIYQSMNYERMGNLVRGLELSEQAVKINRNGGNPADLGSSLVSQASVSRLLGNLRLSVTSGEEAIESFDRIGDSNWRGISHRNYGNTLSICGDFQKALDQLAIAEQAYLTGDEKRFTHGIGRTCRHRARIFEQMGNIPEAIKLAEKAYELSTGDHYGSESTIALCRLASLDFKVGNITSAEAKFHKVLSECHQMNLLELEPDALLGLALVGFTLGLSGQRNLEEPFNIASEALDIADRCGFRLKQAEIHNFLSEWWMAQAESSRQKAVGKKQSSVAEAIAKAKEHAERAKERAWCDGPPYHYKVVYEQAEKMLKQIEDVKS